MRIEQIEFILEVYHQNSMKTASENLHITPQALSSTIKNLETELNTKIFRRSNKGISLTDDGKQFIEFAENTVKNYYKLLQNLTENKKINETQKGTLTLYVAPVFMESILPAYIKKFKKNYPKISINIIQRNSLNISETLQANKSPSTLGAIIIPYDGEKLMHTYLPTDYKDFSYQLLNKNEYYACVPKNSIFANQKSVSIKKLLNEYPMVDYCAGVAGTAPLIPLLQKYMPNLKTSLTLASITLWVEAIENGMGVGFINTLFTRPDSIVSEQLENLVLLKINEPLITFNCFAYLNNPTSSVTAFLQQFPDYIPKKSDPKIDFN